MDGIQHRADGAFLTRCGGRDLLHCGTLPAPRPQVVVGSRETAGALNTPQVLAPVCRGEGDRVAVLCAIIAMIDHWGDTMAGKFEVFKDRAGKFRFRLKASNGQVVATGEAHETRAAAKKGCESVLRAATGAPIEEVES